MDGATILTLEEAMEEALLTNNEKKTGGHLIVTTRANSNVITVKNMGITPHIVEIQNVKGTMKKI